MINILLSVILVSNQSIKILRPIGHPAKEIIVDVSSSKIPLVTKEPKVMHYPFGIKNIPKEK